MRKLSSLIVLQAFPSDMHDTRMVLNKTVLGFDAKVRPQNILVSALSAQLLRLDSIMVTRLSPAVVVNGSGNRQLVSAAAPFAVFFRRSSKQRLHSMLASGFFVSAAPFGSS